MQRLEHVISTCSLVIKVTPRFPHSEHPCLLVHVKIQVGTYPPNFSVARIEREGCADLHLIIIIIHILSLGL